MAADPKKESAALSLLLQLEAKAREAESSKSLQFLMVNETRKLVNYRQAVLYSARGTVYKRYEVEAASSVSIVEKNSPFVQWLLKIAAWLDRSKSADSVRQIDINSLPDELKEDWLDYALPFVLWMPLKLSDETFIGSLWLARETAWTDNEITLVKRLCGSYAHAWNALQGRKYFVKDDIFEKSASIIVLSLIVIALFTPVHMSALAPVEIVAKDPVIVSAPMDGVIADIKIKPNSYVQTGEVLFHYEDTNLRNEYQISKKALSVTEAELRQVTQAAFGDQKSKARVALLKSEVELRKSELQYSEELLNQVVVKAEIDGLVLFSGVDDWIGRPVKVGERVMDLAEPKKMEFLIQLAVDDAIVLTEGAEVKVFLDVDPLNPINGTITKTSYNAELTEKEILAYKLYAKSEQDISHLRIGLQGTAKIYGNEVSLFFYLFRRPISFVRQFIGL